MRRRALLQLDEAALTDLLGLGETVQVWRAFYDNHRDCVMVVLVGEQLPTVAELCEPYVLQRDHTDELAWHPPLVRPRPRWRMPAYVPDPQPVPG